MRTHRALGWGHLVAAIGIVALVVALVAALTLLAQRPAVAEPGPRLAEAAYFGPEVHRTPDTLSPTWDWGDRSGVLRP